MGFADDWAKICKRAGDKAETVTRKAMITLADSMIEKSPVDTGRFRGNWVAGIGSVNKATFNAVDKSGEATLSRISARIDAWQPGQTIFITNSLPYALRLENGWSKQAPSGMVDLSVQQFKDAVAKAAREVKNS